MEKLLKIINGVVAIYRFVKCRITVHLRYVFRLENLNLYRATVNLCDFFVGLELYFCYHVGVPDRNVNYSIIFLNFKRANWL